LKQISSVQTQLPVMEPEDSLSYPEGPISSLHSVLSQFIALHTLTFYLFRAEVKVFRYRHADGKGESSVAHLYS